MSPKRIYIETFNKTFSKYFQVKFRCKLCGYLYSRKDTLKDHIRGKHNPRYSTSDLNSLVEVVPPASTSPNLIAPMSTSSALNDIAEALMKNNEAKPLTEIDQ